VRSSPTARAGPGLLAALAAAATVLTGCSLFGSKTPDVSVSVSVFDIQPGQCFMAPSEIKAELSKLNRVPCGKPHTEESYARVKYSPPGGTPSGAPTNDAYPGAAALQQFANGACAQLFSNYVGVSYLDSSLFFTYLLPSARSWEQDDDRTVVCFVTQTGGTRTGSVKDSKQ
jgi:hypothetical protein